MEGNLANFAKRAAVWIHFNIH